MMTILFFLHEGRYYKSSWLQLLRKHILDYNHRINVSLQQRNTESQASSGSSKSLPRLLK